MHVFNLSDKGMAYKGKVIPPNGGSAEFPGLDFIPNRDLKNKCLAFGSLPRGWKPAGVAQPQPVASTPVKLTALPQVEPVMTVEAPPQAMVEEAQPKEGFKKKRF